jgi:hypothetical protein
MGPFQVTCVLAAAGSAAAFSISSAFAQLEPEGRGFLPLTPGPGSIGERSDADAIAVDRTPDNGRPKTDKAAEGSGAEDSNEEIRRLSSAACPPNMGRAVMSAPIRDR